VRTSRHHQKPQSDRSGRADGRDDPTGDATPPASCHGHSVAHAC